MMNAIYVGLGGFIGSVGRYSLGILVKKISSEHWFPFGTLTVNVLGCFCIGFLSSILLAKGMLSDQLRLFLIVGLLGGFTTFSSFGIETVHLYKSTHSMAALGNIIAHITLCITAAWIGHHLVR